MGAVILAVDLGKTYCRARAGGRRAEGAGAPGLAAPGGVRAAQATILAVARELGPVDEVIVGAAGALAAPDAARALGDALLASLRAERVAVTSDAVIAHAGALDGKPGVVVAGRHSPGVRWGGRDGALQRPARQDAIASVPRSAITAGVNRDDRR
jgi:N-acetylmuramic acid 6-phosphate etherase